MRRILVEQARRKKSLKAGGDLNRIDVENIDALPVKGKVDLLELDDALQRLQELHPRKAKLVELRYFGGLTIERAARALNVATSTVDADWAYARGAALICDEMFLVQFQRVMLFS